MGGEPVSVQGNHELIKDREILNFRFLVKDAHTQRTHNSCVLVRINIFYIFYI